MIYAMLSAGSVWDRFEKFYNPETGHYDTIDKVFCCCNAEKLIEADKIALQTALQHEEIKGGNRSIKVQLKALPANIRKMQKWQKKCGSVDAYLQQFIDEKDGKPDFKRLVRRLADEKSEDKLQQMGEALCAEYLRNVGYDLAKPDAHVCKALGNGEDGIGSVDKIEANPYEVLDIVKEIADAMGKTPAEVDYILWAFYAKGYGDGGKNGCRA